MKRRDGCAHRWVANDGKGGKPIFARAARYEPGPEFMRVVCGRCGHAINVTENQWNGFMPDDAAASVKTRRASRARAAAAKRYVLTHVRKSPWELPS